MSSETTTPAKKTFLTNAMETVRAKQNDDSDETTIPVTNEAAAKRLLVKAGITLIGTVAAVTAVIVIASRLKSEDEISDEETTSED